VLFAEGGEVRLADLPERVAAAGRSPGGAAAAAGAGGDGPFAIQLGTDWIDRSLSEVRGQVVERLERAYLRRLLARTAGRLGDAAQHAGIDERSLYNKMRLYGLRKEDFRRET
jgi:transcriptional regulator of acetoin/glycerol metabolism